MNPNDIVHLPLVPWSFFLAPSRWTRFQPGALGLRPAEQSGPLRQGVEKRLGDVAKEWDGEISSVMGVISGVGWSWFFLMELDGLRFFFDLSGPLNPLILVISPIWNYGWFVLDTLGCIRILMVNVWDNLGHIMMGSDQQLIVILNI